MYRDEAVKIMSDAVEEFNRFLAEKTGVTPEQTEEYIQKSRVQLDYVNGLIYDTLKYNGVIQ